MRVLALGLGWLLGYYLLAQYGVFLLPRSVAQRTTLPEYLAMVQIVSVLLGVGGVLLATRRNARVRATIFPEFEKAKLGLEPSSAIAAFLAPATFLCAYGLGMYFAFDTLISELAARGSQAVQAQTGELGRTAQADTLWTIFPFTVLLAPLGEELLFRGGVYGSIQAFASERFPRTPSVDRAPPSIQIAGLPGKSAGRPSAWSSWLREGGAAVIGSSLCFGLMHADTPGGMGIVRVVSASILGIACGLLRQHTRSLLAPLVLHASYNLISLGSLRGWLVFSGWPTKYTIPTSLMPLSVVCLTLAWVMYLRSRKDSRHTA